MSTLMLSRGIGKLCISHLACLGLLVRTVRAFPCQGILLNQQQASPHLNITLDMNVVTKGQRNSFSSASDSIPDVSYDELRRLLDEHSVVLIDVREPKELRDDGKIPGSVNVPLGELESALQLTADKFASKYGASLPPKDKGDEIVMTCRSGKRATNAVIIAGKLGFEGVRCYCGSFLDWMEKDGPIEKP